MWPFLIRTVRIVIYLTWRLHAFSEMLYSLPFFSNITFFNFLINNFVYFTSPPQFSLPPLLLIPPPILNLYPSLSNSERGRPSICFNKLTYQVETEPSSLPCNKDGRGNPAWKIGSQEPVQAPGTGNDPTARNTTTWINYTTVTHVQRSEVCLMQAP